MNNDGDKKHKSGKKKFFRKVFLNLFFIAIFYLFFKTFFIESIIVNNIFMEGSLHPGDFVLINKAEYKIKLPENIPLLDIKVKSKKIADIKSPELGDLVYLRLPDNNYKINNLFARVIARPADTLHLVDKFIFVNNKKMEFSRNIEYDRNYSIPFGVDEKEFYFKGKGWNQDNFGPLIIPQKGKKIKLTLDNIDFYYDFILDDCGSSVNCKDDRIYIKAKETSEYVVKNNYYFVLGDNRDFAIDSRYVGLIKEDDIIGKARFIYFSTGSKPSGSGLDFNLIRWDRIFKVLK